MSQVSGGARRTSCILSLFYLKGKRQKEPIGLDYEFSFVHVLGLSYLGDSRGEVSQLTVEHTDLNSREK